MMTLIKETNMTFNRLLCGMALCAACVGCISDPYIDESIAKLDRLPKPVKLPVDYDVGDIAAEPIEKDKLLGEWDSGVVEEHWRCIDDGGIYDSKTLLKGVQYVFSVDGSFCRAEAVKLIEKDRYGIIVGVSGYLLKSLGNWNYVNGILTLNTKVYDSQVTSGWDGKVVSKKKEECNLTKVLNITCYKNGRIAFETEDLKAEDSQTDGTRKSVFVDNRGIRTERSIKVTGMRDGREVGVIVEKISSPMKYIRKPE